MKKILFIAMILIMFLLVFPIVSGAEEVVDVSKGIDLEKYIVSALIAAASGFLWRVYENWKRDLRRKEEEARLKYEKDKGDLKLWAKAKLYELTLMFVEEAEYKYSNEGNEDKKQYVEQKVSDNVDPDVAKVLNDNGLTVKGALNDSLHTAVKEVKQGRRFHLGTFLRDTAENAAVGYISEKINDKINR